MEAEYDFSGAQRGKYYERFQKMQLKISPRSRTRALTTTERELLRLLARQLSASQLAEKLAPRKTSLRTLISKMSRLAAEADALSARKMERARR